jgi:hypothetical protein
MVADMSHCYHQLLVPGVIAGEISYLLSWELHDHQSRGQLSHGETAFRDKFFECFLRGEVLVKADDNFGFRITRCGSGDAFESAKHYFKPHSAGNAGETVYLV